MTVALCFVCGAFKVGAWTPCPACAAEPATDDELVQSLAYSDHYLTAEGLAQVQQRVAAGQPVAIDTTLREALLHTLHETGQDQVSRRQRPWWKFW